jgi:hypothetical protein
MQPVSALYVVPFLVVLGIVIRPASSPFMFLWPVLYALHAILIVAGAPIRVGNGLDIFIAIAGYGLLAGLAAHAYSRYALRKLRRLTRVDGHGEAGPREASQ